MLRPRLLSSVLAVAVAVIGASCGSERPNLLAPTRAAEDLHGRRGILDNLTLISCTPLPADTATALIGSDGGTLTVGPHALVIPPGALDSAVLITAIAPSDTLARVQFFPEGLRFNHAVSMTLSYAHCSGLGTLLPKRVVYLDANLSILELLVSLNDPFTSSVGAATDHFSDYAVAW